MKDFGKRLKELRMRKKLSLEQLAEKLEVNRSSLSRVENGHSYPRTETLERMAEFFDVPTSYFYGSEVKLEDIPVDGELKKRATALGIEWIALGERMKEKGLTPEELETIVNFLEVQRKLSK